MTLLELIIAVTILLIGVLGLISGGQYLRHGIQASKHLGLASNLAQEKMERPKNLSYPELIVTTSTAQDSCLQDIDYDTGFFPPDEIDSGGVKCKRLARARKVSESTGVGVQYLNWNNPDAGLRQVDVFVVWNEKGECKRLSLRSLACDSSRARLESSFYGTVSSGTSYGPLLQNALIPMASGTISGAAYVRDHPVISQFMADNPQGSFSAEFVELYNPTTFTLTIASAASEPALKLRYLRRSDYFPLELECDYRSFSIESGKYHLFANTAAVTVKKSATAVVAAAHKTTVNFAW